MWLRMKNFNMGVHLKIHFFLGGGGGHEKPIYWGLIFLKKRGAWTVCRFKRGVCKKERVMYLRGG